MGATIINALSEWLELEIWRDGQHFTQRFERGKPQAARHRPVRPEKAQTGTRLRWKYDRDIFDHDVYYPREMIERRLQAAAHLNRGLALHLSIWDDEQETIVTQTFHSKEGLAEFVRQATPPGTEPLFAKPITFTQLRDEVFVEVALQPNRGYKLDLHSFAQRGAHARRRRARTRLQGGPDAGRQRLRGPPRGDQEPRQGSLQSRGHPAGPGRRHLGQAQGPAVRRPDQVQAEQRARRRHRPLHRHRGLEGVVRSAPRASQRLAQEDPGRSEAGQSPRRRGEPGAHRPEARPRPSTWTPPNSRAPARPTPTAPSCSSSKANPPAATPSKAATPAIKPSSPCAANPST